MKLTSTAARLGLGDDDDFFALHLAAGRQVFQNLPHQGFGSTVRIVGAGINQIDARPEGSLQGFFMVVYPAADPISAESGLAGRQSGSAQNRI